MARARSRASAIDGSADGTLRRRWIQCRTSEDTSRERARSAPGTPSPRAAPEGSRGFAKPVPERAIEFGKIADCPLRQASLWITEKVPRTPNAGARPRRSPPERPPHFAEQPGSAGHARRSRRAIQKPGGAGPLFARGPAGYSARSFAATDRGRRLVLAVIVLRIVLRVALHVTRRILIHALIPGVISLLWVIALVAAGAIALIVLR